MRNPLLFSLLACAAATAAVPTTNLCQDWVFRGQEYAPDFAWRRDSVFTRETERGFPPNEFSWKFRYDAATGYPRSMAIHSFDGTKSPTLSVSATADGFTMEDVESRQSLIHSYESRNDTLVHRTQFIDQGQTKVIWVGKVWATGRFETAAYDGMTDSTRSFLLQDTLRTIHWPGMDPNAQEIDNCTSPTPDSCVCRNSNLTTTLLARGPWNDGFSISSFWGDSAIYSTRIETYFLPFVANTGVARKAGGPRNPSRPSPLRWNGTRPSATSASANPLEQLRRGQIPANTPRP